MNKKVLSFVSCIAIACIGTFVYSNKVSMKTDAITENVEALSDEENTDCKEINVNGYRQWKNNGNWFQSEKSFYDCCSKLRLGYAPKGNCINN